MHSLECFQGKAAVPKYLSWVSDVLLLMSLDSWNMNKVKELVTVCNDVDLVCQYLIWGCDIFSSRQNTESNLIKVYRMFTEMITNSNKRFYAICMNRTTEQCLCNRCLIPRFLFRSYRNFLILYLPTTDIVISLVFGDCFMFSNVSLSLLVAYTWFQNDKSWINVQRNKVTGSQFLGYFRKLKSVKNKYFPPD